MKQISFKATLNRMVNAFPKSVKYWPDSPLSLAQIKCKAQNYIDANPAPRAVFLVS